MRDNFLSIKICLPLKYRRRKKWTQSRKVFLFTYQYLPLKYPWKKSFKNIGFKGTSSQAKLATSKSKIHILNDSRRLQTGLARIYRFFRLSYTIFSCKELAKNSRYPPGSLGFHDTNSVRGVFVFFVTNILVIRYISSLILSSLATIPSQFFKIKELSVPH